MRRFCLTALLFSVLLPLLAQDMEIRGRVSVGMQKQIGESYLYLQRMASEEKLDSCRLNGQDYSFLVNRVQTQEPLLVLPLGLYLVSESGNVTIDENFYPAGTPLNEKWGLYLKDRRVFQHSINRQINEARNDVSLSKSQQQGLVKSLKEEFDASQKSRAMSLMRMNLDNPLNALAFLDYASLVDDLKSFDHVMVLASEQTMQYPAVRRYIIQMEKLRKTSVGEFFSDFRVSNGHLDGTEAKLSEYVGRGKYVLVDFWASWCGPCLREGPFLKKAYEHYHGKMFDMVGVATWDKRSDTLKALDDLHYPWNQIIEAGDIASETYGFKSIPQIILFDPEGRIVARGLRGEEILRKLSECLKNK